MKPRITALLCSLLLAHPLAAYAHEADTSPETEPTAETATASDTTAAADPAPAAKRVDMPGSSAAALGPGGRNITAFDRPGQRGIGGYFSQEFTLPLDGKPAFFDQRQLVLTVSSYVHDNLLFNAEIEYEHGGDVAKGGEIKIEQAWGEWSFADWLNWRTGILLIPLGRLNVLHDADYREATTRPLVTRFIVPSTWFEAGTGFRGDFSPDDQWEFSYEAYVTQGLNNQISAANGMRSARPSAGTDTNPGKAISARFAASPWLGLEMGIGGYATPYDEAAQNWLGIGTADLLWRIGAFEVIAEASLAGTQGGTYTANNQTVQIPTSMGGYYVEGHYSFFPEFLRESFLGKGLGFTDPRFTAFARFGQVDTDFAQVTNDDRAEIVLGLNYRPIPNTALKLEWLREIRAQSGATTDSLISSLAVGF